MRLGGRPLLLTCKDCNNPHGSLDSPAVDRERIHDLLVGLDPGHEVHGELTIGEIRIQIHIEVEGDAFRLRIVDQPSANNPTDIDDTIRLLNELAARQQDPAPEMRFRVVPGPRSNAGIRTCTVPALALLTTASPRWDRRAGSGSCNKAATSARDIAAVELRSRRTAHTRLSQCTLIG